MYSKLIPALLLGVLAAAPSQATGVLCRIAGQTDPSETLEIWNGRWDAGTGARQLNDDCEAIVHLRKGADPQWVGHYLPPHPSYLRARIEIGVDSDFEMQPGAEFPFLKIVAKDAREVDDPPYLVRIFLRRPENAAPGEYELRVMTRNDIQQGVFAGGTWRLGGPERLLVHFDWWASTDSDKDFRPDTDGYVRLLVNGQVVLQLEDLVIDRILADAVRFGFLGRGTGPAEGTFYYRPISVDVGFFSTD